MKQRARLSLNLAWAGYFGLFALLMAWPTLLSPPETLPVALVLLLAPGPLLFTLRGLLHGERNGTAGAAYLSLFYLVHATVESYADAGNRILALTELVSSLTLFLGATYYLKLQAQA